MSRLIWHLPVAAHDGSIFYIFLLFVLNQDRKDKMDEKDHSTQHPPYPNILLILIQTIGSDDYLLIPHNIRNQQFQFHLIFHVAFLPVAALLFEFAIFKHIADDGATFGLICYCDGEGS